MLSHLVFNDCSFFLPYLQSLVTRLSKLGYSRSHVAMLAQEAHEAGDGQQQEAQALAVRLLVGGPRECLGFGEGDAFRLLLSYGVANAKVTEILFRG